MSASEKFKIAIIQKTHWSLIPWEFCLNDLQQVPLWLHTYTHPLAFFPFSSFAYWSTLSLPLWVHQNFVTHPHNTYNPRTHRVLWKKKKFYLLNVHTAVFISDIWQGGLDLFLNILSFLKSRGMDKEAWEILLKLDDGYLGLSILLTLLLLDVWKSP